jgi:peptide/nickel transport system substrate-binding protein
MSKKARVIFGALVALSLLIGACGPAATPTAEEPSEEQPSAATSAPVEEPTEAQPVEEQPVPAEPVVLRVGGVKDVDCWNPWSCSQIYYFLGEYVNEPILSPGKDYACSGGPLLAKSIELSDDGKTQTWHLQEGVTFTDGTPFNAHEHAEYLEWINANEDLKYWWNYTTYMTSVKALDDLTLQITTEYPLFSFTQGDAYWDYIYPAHVWTGLGPDEVYTYENFPPIGTGPFTVAEWRPGEYLIYDANVDYWQGKPPVDRVVYQIYANFDALVQAFLAGEVDVINNDPPIPPIYYDTLASAEDTTVIDYPPGPYYYIAFNLAEGGTKNPAVEDVVVRHAIDSAIDKERLVDVALLGHGITCPTSWACGPAHENEIDPALTVTPYDPAEARSMLEDAGYVDTDGDGVREGPDGTPMNLRLSITQENPVHLAVADLLKGWLGDVGIAVEVMPMEIGTQFSVVLTERDFDMVLFGFTQEFSAAAMEFYYSCWAAEAGGYAWNFAGYCNPELDDLMFQIVTAPTKEELLATSFDFQQVINQELPRLILFGQTNTQAFHTDRFEFDTDICFSGQGVWDAENLMNLKVK